MLLSIVIVTATVSVYSATGAARREPGLSVVHVRRLWAFNGLACRRDACGGRLPGAVAFPAAWLERIDDAELKVMRESNRRLGRSIAYAEVPSPRCLPPVETSLPAGIA